MANKEWHNKVEKVKSERAVFESALREDMDLKVVRESKRRLSENLKMGSRERVDGRIEQVVEESTCFWRDGSVEGYSDS